MLSKYLRQASGRCTSLVFGRDRKSPHLTAVRRLLMIPPTQYDMPWPKRLTMQYILTVQWEIIPLILCVVYGCALGVFFTYWSVQNKVDVVFKTRSRENISRTMDLRSPTTHKLFINQKHEPWPEMQDVLDKMNEAERRAALETCE